MEPTQMEKLKADFDQDGYIVIRGFLTSKEMSGINERLESYISEMVPGMPANQVFYEDKNDTASLKQLQDMQSYDPVFSALLFGSKFEAIAEILLGEKVMGKTIEYFNKPPKLGKATPPHQDAYYFMLKPPQALTMWIALEHVDEQTGCVRYIRGSHLRGMRPHARTRTPGFSQGITDYGQQDLLDEVPCPAAPGDLLIHHSMTIHRADANTSDTRSRKALGLIYFGESAQEDSEAKAAYLQTLAKEAGH